MGGLKLHKYEEEKYQFEYIKDKIYPWVKETLIDYELLNGKEFSEKDTPMVRFVGDLKICFVIAREHGTFELLKDNMISKEQDIEALYAQACQNLVNQVEFVVSHTLYGGFGIVADGHHEASALIYKHIWNMCCEKLEDDLVIMVPAKDMLLFVPAKDQSLIGQMQLFAYEAYNRNKDKISRDLFIFSKDKGELQVYEK